MLPFELESREAIQKEHGVHLRNCQSVQEFAMRFTSTLVCYEMAPRPLAVICGIVVRETRKLRSVQMLLESGFVGEASQLTRSLFEGLLATSFVMNEPLSAAARPDGIADPKYPPIPGGQPHIEFRALVYAGHMLMQRHRMNEDPQIAALVSVETRDALRKLAATLEDEIGAEWCQRLGRTKGYAGISVKDLAGNYGLSDFYTYYKDLSNHTHANDAFETVSFHREGALLLWGGNASEVPQIAKISSLWLGWICHDIAKALDLPFQREAFDLCLALNQIN
jgi:hypothetical protein